MGYRPPAIPINRQQFLKLARQTKWGAQCTRGALVLMGQLGGDIRIGDRWYRVTDSQPPHKGQKDVR